MSHPMKAPDIALNLFGVPVHDVTMEETVAWIGHWISTGGSHQIATVNPEFLMKARANKVFRLALQQADLCLPDGIGVVWAARCRGIRLRQRVAGSDLVPRLAGASEAHGWRIFFLGAAPGVAEKTTEILTQLQPGLQVAGCYAGSPALEEEEEIVSRVRSTQPDILLVAYGAPKQDLWLSRNLARTGAAVGIGVGGSFDFIAGVSRRAPRWIRRLGLEWFHRLVREPWRWRRQLALPHFAWLMLTKRDQTQASDRAGHH
jgi:N-acetylglucosaminyldiphosphoundecaprenol N-acetyl-beta-D-mannosaminyltransferase